MSRPDRDQVILAAIVNGATNKAAADMAGCSVRTVERVRGGNRQAIDQARVELGERLADVLSGAVEGAVQTLRGIAADPAHRDAVAAARILLAEARSWRADAYLEPRLARVEDELALRRSAS